jgi:hypothetical protein
MVKTLPDGTVISSNMPVKLKPSKDEVLYNYGIYRAYVVNTIFTDDKKNRSKNHVEYDIMMISEKMYGMIYKNVLSLEVLGADTNFSEVVLNDKESKISGQKSGEKASPENYDDSYVMVAFYEGSTPIILGPYPHPKRTVTGATQAEGIRKRSEFNGLRSEINKDGEMILTYLGGPRDAKTKESVGKTTAPLQIKIDKTGAFYVLDKECQEIKIDRVSKKLTIIQYSQVLVDETESEYSSGYVPSVTGAIINKVELDKDGKKITLLQNDESLKVEMDGASKIITITDGSGDLITIDKTNKEVKVNANGGILKLKNGKVALGTSSHETLDVLATLLGVFSTNESVFVQTAVGPGKLNPVIKAAVDNAQSYLNSIKESI